MLLLPVAQQLLHVVIATGGGGLATGGVIWAQGCGDARPQVSTLCLNPKIDGWRDQG